MNTSGTRKIHILDPATVNQIAAGEVVERPASVIKELVENSIDAGATRIIVEMESGGDGFLSLRVVDNGCGIGPDDLVSAFTPHATSKIATIDDLNECRTLGFRGEALASIAAVSEVRLVSSERDSNSYASEIVIRSGEIVKSGGTGAPPGTSVTVRDLFFNTPARKKFQKRTSSEIAFVVKMIEAFCIANPGIAFRLSWNGKEKVATEGSGDLYDVIIGLYGNEVAESLIPVRVSGGPLTVTGYISVPSLSRPNPYQILVSINRRQVLARTIVDAIRAGYGTLLPDDRYPVAFLDLEINPAFIDVNVHPSKRVVHLSRERDICGLVTGGVVAALGGADLVPAGTPGSSSPAGIPVAGSPPDNFRDINHRPRGVFETDHTAYLTSDKRLRQSELLLTGSPAGEVREIEYLGQYDGAYIVAKDPEGELLLIDQHAAHERVIYEQVALRRESWGETQELIVPVILRFSPAEQAALHECIPLLAKKGFMIEAFGKDSYAVREVPVVLGKTGKGETVRDIIADFIRSPGYRGSDSDEHLTRTIACHAAVKAGTVLTAEQARRLLAQLVRASSPWTCPHGRPVMIRFSRDHLDRMFGRK